MDVLAPRIGEIIGGSQREERHDAARVNGSGDMGSRPEGRVLLVVPRPAPIRRRQHAGFGLGFERMMMYLTGMKNIRDVIPFPRTPGNAEF